MKQIASALVCFLVIVTFAVPAVADRKYSGRHGYRERPYDNHRNYTRRPYQGRQYTYKGHWRSWNDFDNYARGYPRLHRQGHYYREDGHLMFRFCDTDSSGCFFFSIGR